MKDIDWLNVDAVLSGFRVKLNGREQRMVVRRLAHKLLKPTDQPRPGKITAHQLAYQIGVSERQIPRFLNEFANDIESLCPVCHDRMWIVDGVVEEHPDGIEKVCAMSGKPYPTTCELSPDDDWEQWAAVTVKRLAERLRDGDVYGVNDWIERSARAKELLVVALAAVDVNKPIEELFAWVEEVA